MIEVKLRWREDNISVDKMNECHFLGLQSLEANCAVFPLRLETIYLFSN